MIGVTVGEFFDNISNYGFYHFYLIDDSTDEVLLEDPDYDLPDEFYDVNIIHIDFDPNKEIRIVIHAPLSVA